MRPVGTVLGLHQFHLFIPFSQIFEKGIAAILDEYVPPPQSANLKLASGIIVFPSSQLQFPFVHGKVGPFLIFIPFFANASIRE
jgi:hypothetical protein